MPKKALWHNYLELYFICLKQIVLWPLLTLQKLCLNNGINNTIFVSFSGKQPILKREYSIATISLWLLNEHCKGHRKRELNLRKYVFLYSTEETHSVYWITVQLLELPKKDGDSGISGITLHSLQKTRMRVLHCYFFNEVLPVKGFVSCASSGTILLLFSKSSHFYRHKYLQCVFSHCPIYQW